LFRASREASEATGMADLTDNARIFPGTDQWDENVVQKWAGNTRGVSEGCCPTQKKNTPKKNGAWRRLFEHPLGKMMAREIWGHKNSFWGKGETFADRSW